MLTCVKTVIALCVLLGGVAAALPACGGGAPGPADAPASSGSPAASPPGSTEALLVVRRAGGADDLVLYSGGAARTIGTLPGRAAVSVAAPDGGAVAYLPMKWGPRFWVATPAGVVRTVSLARLGVTLVDTVTWISPTGLVASGRRRSREPDAAKDFLYEVSTGSWTVAPFRGLRGTEPSGAAEAGRLVFVAITDVGPAADRPWARTLRERLLLLDVDGEAAPRAIETTTYSSSLDLRAFSLPQLAPDGEHVVTSTAGGDMTVTYRIWRVGGGKALFSKRTACPGRAAGVWDAAGARVAFAGLVHRPDTDMQARVWVYDLGTERLAASGLLGSFTAVGLAWSRAGDLAIARAGLGKDPDEGTVSLAAAGSLTGLTELGAGGLPAWVRP